MKPRKQSSVALLGSFEEQIMLAVLRTGGDAHGMNIRREVETVTGRSTSIGSVYATLDRLEAKGLIVSARITVQAGVSRRLFQLTSAGGRSLAETRAVRDRLWAGVSLRTARDKSS
jgi:PadR family transcriptional regulator PadR